MAGSVSDDEFPLVSRKITVSHINRNSLLPLVFETICKKGEIKFAAGCAVAGCILTEGGKLVLVHRLGLIKKPADERAFTIIDAATGDETENLLTLVLGKVGVDVAGDER